MEEMFLSASILIKTKIAVTFVPYDNKKQKLVIDAIKAVSKLIPYMASTIAIRYNLIQCAVCISGTGTSMINTNVYFFDDNNIKPYPLNHDTIDFLLRNISKLNSIDKEIQIAITGEQYAFSLNEDDYNIDTFRSPNINPNYVFSDDEYYYSNMFILSKIVIPGAKPISWAKDTIFCDFVHDDVIARLGNILYRNFVKISNAGKLVIIANKQSDLNITGRVPNDSEIHNDYNINEQNKLLSKVLDKYAMKYIEKDHLIGNINFKDFSYEGNSQIGFTKYKMEKANEFKLNGFDMDEYLEIIRQQNQLGDIYSKLDRVQKEKVKQLQGDLKNRKEALTAHLTKENKEEIQKLFNPKFIEDYFKESKIIEKLGNITKIKKHGKGCFSFISYEKDINEKIESIKSEVNSYEPSNFDIIPLYNIRILHRADSRISKEDFCNIIQKILGKYGKIIYHKKEYKENEKTNDGFIQIEVLTCDFIFPISAEIGRALQGEGQDCFRISRSTDIDIALLHRKNVKDAFKSWFNENKLGLRQEGLCFYGSHEDVARANELIKTNPPDLPFKSQSIPGGTNIDILIRKVQSFNKRMIKEERLLINKTMKIITYPKSFKNIDKLLSQNKDENEDNDEQEENIIIGDILWCGEEAVQSRNQIYIFKKDESYEAHNFCITCLFDTLKNKLGNLYNEKTKSIKYEDILGNMEPIGELQDLWDCSEDPETHEIWPIISFGQMMWSLIEEPVTTNIARGYLTAIGAGALHKSQIVTFCPCHPAVVYRHPLGRKRINCYDKKCPYFLCQNCNKWHIKGKCNASIVIPPGFRLCPNCKNIVEKSEQCNHLHCRCGMHFCYYCEAGPWNTSEECYSHIRQKHVNCFNDPPDYKKFCKHENVSTQELESFYSEYPKFKNRVEKFHE